MAKRSEELEFLTLEKNRGLVSRSLRSVLTNEWPISIFLGWKQVTKEEEKGNCWKA